MMKNFLAVLCFLAPLAALAQPNQSSWKEFDLQEDYDNYALISLNEQGVLIYAEKDESDERGMSTWQLTHYDTEFNEIHKQEINIEKRLSYMDAYTDGKRVYLLFHRLYRKAYSVVAYDIATEKAKIVSGEVPAKTVIKTVTGKDDYAYLIGSKKGNSVVVALNVESGLAQTIIKSKMEGGSIPSSNIQIEENGENIYLSYKQCARRNECNFHVVRLSTGGKEVDHWVFDDPEYTLIAATVSRLKGEGFIITGTYGTKAATTSEGMYFAKVNGGQVEFIKYLNFLEFDNFTSYMSEKSQEKLERKKAKKERKGKTYSMDVLMAIHDLIELKDEYIFVGEVYYPTYRAQTHTTTVNGQTTTTTTYVFDGYQYSHAVVASFDRKGEKLWDQTFEMWVSQKPFYPKKFINISVDEKDELIKLVFISYTTVKSMSFSGGEVVDDRTVSDIESDREDDKVRGAYSNMEHWYGQNFIAWGFQTIKNKKDKSVKRKRRIFYVSKIAF